jgi:hypothetical protein
MSDFEAMNEIEKTFKIRSENDISARSTSFQHTWDSMTCGDAGICNDRHVSSEIHATLRGASRFRRRAMRQLHVRSGAGVAHDHCESRLKHTLPVGSTFNSVP